MPQRAVDRDPTVVDDFDRQKAPQTEDRAEAVNDNFGTQRYEQKRIAWRLHGTFKLVLQVQIGGHDQLLKISAVRAIDRLECVGPSAIHRSVPHLSPQRQLLWIPRNCERLAREDVGASRWNEPCIQQLQSDHELVASA